MHRRIIFFLHSSEHEDASIRINGVLQPRKNAILTFFEIRVMQAEQGLVVALQESEGAGIKLIGVLQPTEDIEARLLLERLRQKRVRRWGASRRGMHV